MTPIELRTARRKARLTREELARRLGVTVSAISRWEQGRRAISAPVAIAVRSVIAGMVS